jgi:hypothetical protein
MNSRKKYAFVAVMATVAGFAYIKNLQSNIPSDLRDAVADLTDIKTSDMKAQSAANTQTPTPTIPLPPAPDVFAQSINEAKSILTAANDRVPRSAQTSIQSYFSYARPKPQTAQADLPPTYLGSEFGKMLKVLAKRDNVVYGERLPDDAREFCKQSLVPAFAENGRIFLCNSGDRYFSLPQTIIHESAHAIGHVNECQAAELELAAVIYAGLYPRASEYAPKCPGLNELSTTLYSNAGNGFNGTNIARVVKPGRFLVFDETHFQKFRHATISAVFPLPDSPASLTPIRCYPVHGGERISQPLKVTSIETSYEAPHRLTNINTESPEGTQVVFGCRTTGNIPLTWEQFKSTFDDQVILK